MIEECSNRLFQRTIVNIRPFRASRAPPPPHHDMLSHAPLDPDTIIALRRTDDPAFGSLQHHWCQDSSLVPNP